MDRPVISLITNFSRSDVGPRPTRATAWVCSAQPDRKFSQISFNPGCFYKFESQPSNTASRVKITMVGSKLEAAIRNERTLTSQQESLVSRLPDMWCEPSPGTNGAHVDLLLFSIKQETDGLGVPFPEAWRVVLSENQGSWGSGLSAVFHVNTEGTIDEQSGPGHSNWSQLRVDGTGADLPPPVRAPNNPHHHH
jgi:hypothetical protein